MKLLAALSISLTLTVGAVLAAQPTIIIDPSGVNQLKVNSDGSLNATATATVSAFAPTGYAQLGATTATSNVALGSVGPSALVVNSGTNTAYINFGGSGVTATTSQYPIFPGQSAAFNVGSNTFMAAITNSGTSSLSVITGTGSPSSFTTVISALSLPLPAGASTAALQSALNGDGGSLVHVTNFGNGNAVTAVANAYATCAIVDIGCGASPAANTVNANLVAQLAALQAPAALLAGNGASTINAPFRQTTTTSAAAFASQNFVNGLIITALSTNANPVYVGSSTVTTATGYPLYPGSSISYNVSTSANLYLIGLGTADVIAVTGN